MEITVSSPYICCYIFYKTQIRLSPFPPVTYYNCSINKRHRWSQREREAETRWQKLPGMLFFLIAVSKLMPRSSLRKGIVGLTVWGIQPIAAESRGSRTMKLVTWHFIQSGTLAHGMVPDTFQGDVSSPSWTPHPRRDLDVCFQAGSKFYQVDRKD